MNYKIGDNCPNCKETKALAHFSEKALKCSKCKAFIPKPVTVEKKEVTEKADTPAKAAKLAKPKKTKELTNKSLVMTDDERAKVLQANELEVPYTLMEVLKCRKGFRMRHLATSMNVKDFQITLKELRKSKETSKIRAYVLYHGTECMTYDLPKSFGLSSLAELDANLIHDMV